MKKNRFLLPVLILCIIIGLLCISGCADNSLERITGSNSISRLNADQQAFYIMMVEYWIPDLYEIKGGILLALRASSGFDALFKAACQDGITRLDTNIAEMNQYQLSETTLPLRAAYVLYAQHIQALLSQAEHVDQTEPDWVNTVEKSMSALSMYASWLQYHVIEAFSSSQIASQEYASLSADTFMNIVKQMTG